MSKEPTPPNASVSPSTPYVLSTYVKVGVALLATTGIYTLTRLGGYLPSRFTWDSASTTMDITSVDPTLEALGTQSSLKELSSSFSEFDSVPLAAAEEIIEIETDSMLARRQLLQTNSTGGVRRTDTSLQTQSQLPDTTFVMPLDSALLFEDRDVNDTLTLSLTRLEGTESLPAPSWLALAPLPGTQWDLVSTPQGSDVGNYKIELTATDLYGGTAKDSFTWRVEGAPQRSIDLPRQFAKVGLAFNYFLDQGVISDPNFDPLVYRAFLANGHPLPDWLSFSGISATFAGTPLSADVGLLNVTITATDNIADTLITPLEIYVDHPPIEDQGLDTWVVGIDQTTEWVIPAEAFNDRDQDPLAYQARRIGGDPLPSWIQLDESGVFTAQANSTHAGLHLFEMQVRDPYQGVIKLNFVVQVQYFPELLRPVTDQLVAVGHSLSIPIPANTFIDNDHPSVSYLTRLSDGSPLPLWLNFNRATLFFSGIPTASQVGEWPITLIARDALGAEASITFRLTVTHFPKLPVPMPALVFEVDQAVDWRLPPDLFVDEDNEPLAFNLTTQPGSTWPAGLTFDAANQRLYGTPNQAGFAQYALQLSATDPHGAQAIQAFTLTFEHAPRVNQALTSLAAGINVAFQATLPQETFIDEDQDELRLTARQVPDAPLPDWLSFHGPTATFSGLAKPSDAGLFTVQLTATDPYGGIARFSFPFGVTHFPQTVREIPVPPVLRAHKPFHLTLADDFFSDADDGTLTYSVADKTNQLPRWLSFDPNTRILSGTPGTSDAGQLALTVTATDPQGGQASLPLTLAIEPNYPPEIVEPLSNQVAEVWEEFRFFVPPTTFVDRNGDNLTYTATSAGSTRLPRWLSFDADHLVFTGVPARRDTGTLDDIFLDMTVTASDGSQTTDAPFRITVSGNSHLELFLKIGLPLITLMGIAYAAYKKRSLATNRIKQERYQTAAQQTQVGQRYEYELKVPKTEVHRVQAKLPAQPAPRYCGGLFTSPKRWCRSGHQHLVDGMPYWLEYDNTRNAVVSKGIVPSVKHDQLIIQVKNTANEVIQEFTLTVQSLMMKRAYGSDTDEMKAPMSTMLAPLISVPANSSGGERAISQWPDYSEPMRKNTETAKPEIELAVLQTQNSAGAPAPLLNRELSPPTVGVNRSFSQNDDSHSHSSISSIGLFSELSMRGELPPLPTMPRPPSKLVPSSTSSSMRSNLEENSLGHLPVNLTSSMRGELSSLPPLPTMPRPHISKP